MRKQFRSVLSCLAVATVVGVALGAPWEDASAAEGGKTPSKPAPAKAKRWKNAWAPENKPLRGIIVNGWGAVGAFETWREFCTRHGLAWCDADDTRKIFDLLDGIAVDLGRPELANAPVVAAGLSSLGYQGIMLAQEHPDRVLAVLGAQPVAPFAKGNEGFNFNRPPLPKDGEKSDEKLVPQEVARAMGVPILMQIGEGDSTLGSAVAYGFFKFGRGQGAPWTYFCLPRGGHGNVVQPEVVMPWLDAVLAQRLPADVDLRQGQPKLKAVKVDDGWLGHTQTLAIDDHSKYEGDKSKASWLPDRAAAEAWKKHGLGMPYEFPEQPLRRPSGLIGNLVVHDPKNKRVVPSDIPSGDAWKIVADLKEGDSYCATHWYHATAVGKVPDVVRGCDWIKPDNVAAEFTGETLLEFTVTDDALVYVGHEEKIAKKPAWLADWKDTGQFVLAGYLGNEHSLRLFEKAFPKNARVKLGPNGGEPKEQRAKAWIYITIVKPSQAR